MSIEEHTSTRNTRYEIIEKNIRKRTFGILTTVDLKNRPHPTGILYGVSPPTSRLAFYFVTQSSTAKVKHIKNNPEVSFMVTFPHYYLRFLPDNTVMLRGKADFVSLDDPDVQWAFSQSAVLRENLDLDSEIMMEAIVIRMIPYNTIYCYGVGISMNRLRKDPRVGSYKVTIP